VIYTEERRRQEFNYVIGTSSLVGKEKNGLEVKMKISERTERRRNLKRRSGTHAESGGGELIGDASGVIRPGEKSKAGNGARK